MRHVHAETGAVRARNAERDSIECTTPHPFRVSEGGESLLEEAANRVSRAGPSDGVLAVSHQLVSRHRTASTGCSRSLRPTNSAMRSSGLERMRARTCATSLSGACGPIQKFRSTSPSSRSAKLLVSLDSVSTKSQTLRSILRVCQASKRISHPLSTTRIADLASHIYRHTPSSPGS